MTSETDSEFSSSENEKKHKKLRKELKKKLEKKQKKLKKKSRSKEKKRSRKDEKTFFNRDDRSQKQRAEILYTVTENDVQLDGDTFGPALPPHLLNKNKEGDANQLLLIGPTMPKELLEKLESSHPQNLCDESLSTEEKQTEDDNLQCSYGPLPVTNELEMTPAQIELEQRALELKMAAIDGITAPTTNQKVREEWMLELPDVGLKGGLAALNNLKRGFHQGKEKPDFSDRSSWTKTPNSGQEEQKPNSSKADMELEAQKLYEKQRDAEQEMIAKKHKKKHKRADSLLEIHQKKLRAEEKRKAKELKESGLKPERRPFTRDVDLKLNKIDRNQTKQIVDKAKILNTKFASGHSKYL